MIKIAIGSTRAAKVNAVRASVERIAVIEKNWHNAEIISRSVEISVPAMPLTKEALMLGARERAIAVRDLLKQEDRSADIYVGLEGGFDTIEILQEPHDFLCGWVYATDDKTLYAYGSAPSISVPTEIYNRVVGENLELAHVIDEISGEKDVRSRQGAWGILSRGLFTRSMSFEIALIAALAPFYNSKLYQL